jgi:pimeloyl-ACP methyl ester carboxylesterase
VYRVIQVDGRRSLERNRLEDPCVRDVGLLLPPEYEQGDDNNFPLILCLSGFGTTGPSMAETRNVFEAPLYARIFLAMKTKRVPSAIIAFPDCSTRYGGSQFVNSTNASNMQDFLIDDLIDCLDQNYRNRAKARSRILVGRSSGGFGAIRGLIDRPERIGVAGALAPDCMFEHCYLPFFSAALEYWATSVGYEKFVASPREVELKDHRYMLEMSLIAMASVYSPRQGPDGYGVLFALPYDPETGTFNAEAWNEWKAHDIDRIIDSREAAKSSCSGRLLVSVGRRDEYNMRVAARYLLDKLRKSGVLIEFTEFDGYHSGNSSILIDMMTSLLKICE